VPADASASLCTTAPLWRSPMRLPMQHGQSWRRAHPPSLAPAQCTSVCFSLASLSVPYHIAILGHDVRTCKSVHKNKRFYFHRALFSARPISTSQFGRPGPMPDASSRRWVRRPRRHAQLKSFFVGTLWQHRVGRMRPTAFSWSRVVARRSVPSAPIDACRNATRK
jgi:hypothetical protein